MGVQAHLTPRTSFRTVLLQNIQACCSDTFLGHTHLGRSTVILYSVAQRMCGQSDARPKSGDRKSNMPVMDVAEACADVTHLVSSLRVGTAIAERKHALFAASPDGKMQR
jgi:hypothetical protein